MEEVAANGIDIIGLFAGQAENDGDVVGGEGPEDVLLPADLAEAQAAGVDILEAADGSFVDHLLQADHGGVVLEDVTDEEDLLFGFGQADEGCAFVVGQRQGLFDEAVFAGIEGLRGQGVVLGGRSGDDDGLDCGIGEKCIEIIGDGGVRVVFGHLLADGAGLVADGLENAELMEVPDEVLAPVAGADEGDVFFSHKNP